MNKIFIDNNTLYLFDRVAISFGGDCMSDDTSFYGIAVFVSIKQAIFFGLSIDRIWNSDILKENFEE